MRLIFFSLIVTIFLAGCGMFEQTAKENNPTNEQQLIHVKNSTTTNIDRKDGQQIADHLVSLASRVPEVNDATAVVIGNYAIVGIDVNKDLERSEVGSIKYTVAESLKNDRYGARAIVVADTDMNERLKEIREDINNNRPIQGIMNELADITGRLMPEIPGDIIEPHSQNAPEEPKNKLNKQENKRLEKEQQDQSNQYKEQHE